MENNNVNQMNDPVFDEVNAKTAKDQLLAEECVTDIVTVLQNHLDKKDNDFTIKHGFLALGRCMVYLTQTLCTGREHFEEERVKADKLAIDKLLPSIMPVHKDGKIVDPNFDMEDLSMRRLLMALGVSVDYAFWRNEISNYAQKRANAEKKELEEVKEDADSNDSI